MADALDARDKGHLKHLIGSFTAGDKKLVPLQAADLVLWHLRRLMTGEASQTDFNRFDAMLNGRPRNELGMSREALSDMGVRTKENTVPNPFPPKRPRESSEGAA